MKNSLKLLLLSLVGIITLTSPIHALELMTSKSEDQVFWEKNWYHLRVSYNKLYCLSPSSSPSDNPSYIKLEAPICDSGNTKYINRYSSIGQYFTLPIFGWKDYSPATYYINQDNKKLYTIHRIDKEWGGYQYIRTNLNEWSIYKIQSGRGSNLYLSAFLHWPWLTFIKKQDQGVRMATYVSQIYVLDGFAIFADTRKLLLIDTYKNKVYDYGTIRQEADIQEDNKTLFTKLYNLTPEKVYDIQRGIGQGKFTYSFEGNGSVSFDLHNEQLATDETLTTIQQDLKDSLTRLNEYSPLRLGTTLEELGIPNGQPNTPNQPNNWGNTNQSYEQSLAEYNQCVAKYTKIKAMTAHSDGCFWSNLDNDERQTYWYNVIDGNDSQYNTRDKIRYWRCWQFANYKADTKQSLWDARPAFWQEWKSNYLGLEAKDVDIPALCGAKPQKQTSSSPEYSYFASSWFRNVFIDAWDWFRGRRWDPAKISGSWEKLYDVDFTEEYGLLRSEYWKCNWFDSLWIKQIYYTDQEIAANCNTYQQSKVKLLSKWDWAKLGKIYWWNVQNALTKLEARDWVWLFWKLKDDISWTSEVGNALISYIRTPYLSWYNSFLYSSCTNKFVISNFDAFVYLFFLIIILYFLRFL